MSRRRALTYQDALLSPIQKKEIKKKIVNGLRKLIRIRETYE